MSIILLSYAYLGDDVDLVAPGDDGHVVALLHYLGLAQLYLIVTHRHLCTNIMTERYA